MPIVSWIKTHKLASVLLVVLLIVLGSKRQATPVSYTTSYSGVSSAKRVSSTSLASPSLMNANLGVGGGMADSVVMPEAVPQTGVTDRMVIRESSLSLLVKDVAKTRDDIIAKAQTFGGYMVNASTSNPGETPSATVVVRVSADKLKDMLTLLRGMAVKVVSENLSGYDVTDQYVDIDKRITLLETTKTKFTAILDSAKEISDITNLNQQIINIQEQIDSYKGQQEALAKNAELARLTVYLSTDEISLPYAPDTAWRPAVIFKLAVRGLVADLRGIGEKAIWVAVYAIVWIPTLAIIWFVWKLVTSRKKK